jgi:membrane dipeptidase
MHALRPRFAGLAALAALLAGCGGSAPEPSASPSDPLTLDTHIDIPLDYATDTVDPLTDPDLLANLTKMEAGGLDAGFFIVYVAQLARTPENYAQAQADALTKFAAIHRMAEQLYPERIEIAYSPADVGRIAASGKLVAIIGIENGFALGANLEMLERYYELGGRYLGLVHNGDNDLARSAQPRAELGDAAEDTGVTALGAEAIARMNRLGMIVDVSHGSKRTALDAIRLSVAPVVASHSSVAAVSAHARNLDDETLLALAARGGVVQVVAFDGYLKRQPEEKAAAQRELRQRVGLAANARLSSLAPEQRAGYEQGMRDIEARWPAATVAQLVDHIDYAVNLIGIDHVGIASDFDGGGGITGWSDASETANVTAELRTRGYGNDDIAKIWSGNLLRVWREVERTAAELETARN